MPKSMRLKIHPEFHLWYSKVYEVPLIASCFLPKGRLSPRGWRALQKAFKSKFKGPFKNKPYITYLYKTTKELNLAKKNLSQYGLKVVDKFNYNIFTQLRPVELPKGYYFRVGEYLDKKIYTDHDKILAKAFPDGELFIRKNKQLTRELNLETKIVVIYNQQSKPVATAGVCYSSKHDTAWLFGGAVLSAYRRKGLWRALVAIRQAITIGHGVQRWYLATQTPAIMKKTDEITKMAMFN